MTPRPRIPLTVIGGFLGAGKTTLLNHLLSEARGQRIAALVNDFGAINLDRALIASQSAEAIELTNGCVCCTLGDDLTDTLIRLLASPQPPEAIVIEASGVSDPWRLAQVGLADPALALNAVLVLADADALPEQAADPLLADTIQRQLRAADLLVLNKCELPDDEALQALRRWLDAEAPGTPRIETTQARVPAQLLGMPLHAGPRQPQLGQAPRLVKPVDHSHTFDTWSLEEAPVFSARALRALLKAMPRGVLRLKGLVRTDEHALAELHFAGRHGSLRAAPPGAASAAAGAHDTLVAIGLQGQLPATALEAAFAAAAHPVAAVATPVPTEALPTP